MLFFRMLHDHYKIFKLCRGIQCFSVILPPKIIQNLANLSHNYLPFSEHIDIFPMYQTIQPISQIDYLLMYQNHQFVSICKTLVDSLYKHHFMHGHVDCLYSIYKYSNYSDQAKAHIS